MTEDWIIAGVFPKNKILLAGLQPSIPTRRAAAGARQMAPATKPFTSDAIKESVTP